MASGTKIAVYTCITDNYDKLAPPENADPRLDYYYFTDNSAGLVAPWALKSIDLRHLSAKDQNRYIKMHPHVCLPDYDVTVYVDGYIQIVGDLHELICAALKSPEDVFLYKHLQRNCVFTEAAACAHYSHGWIWTIAAQMRKYSAEGYPVNNGLFEANVIVRKNTARMRRLMDMWWSEYCSGTKRDQLSLPVAAWRLGIPLGSLGESDPRLGQRYFRLVRHLKRPGPELIAQKYINRFIASLASYQKLFGLTAPVSWK